MRPFRASPLVSVLLCILIRAHTNAKEHAMCFSCTLQIYFQSYHEVACNTTLPSGVEGSDFESLKIVWKEADPTLQYLVVMSLDNYFGYKCPPETPRTYYFITTATLEQDNQTLKFSNTSILEFREEEYLYSPEEYYIYVTLFLLSKIPEGTTIEEVGQLAQKANTFDKVLAPLGISKPFDVVKAWHRFRFASGTTLSDNQTTIEETTTLMPEILPPVLKKAALKSGSLSNVPGSRVAGLYCSLATIIFYCVVFSPALVKRA